MTELVPSPTSSVISPYATTQSIRVSADVLDADDPAAELAARFLLRHPEGTRRVYGADLREWFSFASASPCRSSKLASIMATPTPATWPKRHGARAGRWRRRLSTASSRPSPASTATPSLPRVLSESPFLGVAWPTVSEDSPTTGLTRDELRRLIAVANDDGSRSAALITLLAINGLRITEAISRHVEHLTYDQGHRVLLLERKGGKRAKAPLSPAVVRALDGYLGDRASGPILLPLRARSRPHRRLAPGAPHRP